MPKDKRKIDDYLAPWEVDKDGKKLDEPADIDPAKLKQYIFNLLDDKDELQVKVETLTGERDTAIGDLATIRQEHEDDETRRKREDKEREQRYAKLEAEATERKKIEALETHFEEQGITSARAKRLAKRIPKDTEEKDWISEAEELVEDGFRVSDPQKKTEESEETPDDTEVPSVRPRVRRSDGSVPEGAVKKKYATVGEELDAAGIGGNNW